jgi:hypothetical protein
MHTLPTQCTPLEPVRPGGLVAVVCSIVIIILADGGENGQRKLHEPVVGLPCYFDTETGRAMLRQQLKQALQECCARFQKISLAAILLGSALNILDAGKCGLVELTYKGLMCCLQFPLVCSSFHQGKTMARLPACRPKRYPYTL